MKKSLLLLAALATMSLAQAQNIQSGTLLVGDYEGATTVVEGSYWDSAPTTFYLCHTGSQMIYTAEDLADLAGLDGVKIQKLTYRFMNVGGYETMTRDVKVYLQEIETTEFAKIEGVKQFFDFDETAPCYSAVVDYDLVETYGDDGELEFDLSAAPFAVTPGKGLLVTVVMDALDDSNGLSSSFDLQFYNTGYRHRAMTFTHNNVSFLDYKETEDFPDATSMLGCGTDIDLPVTKIDYSYVSGESLFGDVNNDGIVDISDVNIVIDVMLGKATNPGADVDGNGTPDISDVNAIINAMLGK